MTTEQRLDSIERLLAATSATLQTTAINLETVATGQAMSQQNLSRLEVLTEQNVTAIGELRVLTEQNIIAIGELRVQVAQTTQSLEDSCNDMVSMIGRSVEQGERDRDEIRRILDYLFGQQRNGNGSGSQGG